MDKPVFEPLTVESLPGRLAGIAALKDRVGADGGNWKVREVGDGNLNLVFIVEGERGSVVVKQALPYVRLVGDSWPLPLNAPSSNTTRRPGKRRGPGHGASDPSFRRTPSAHRHGLSVAARDPAARADRGPAIARPRQAYGPVHGATLFLGSDLAMDTAERKADLALFAGNVELCHITESLVFSDPYFDAPRNQHNAPALDGIVARLRADPDLKVAAQHMKHLFCANAQTLVHGDLHSGSIMVTDTGPR